MKKLLRELFHRLFYTKYEISIEDGDDFVCNYLYLKHMPTNGCEIDYYDTHNDEWYYLYVERTGISFNNGKNEYVIYVTVQRGE